MENIFLSTGPSAYDVSQDPISGDSLGVRYVSYRNIFRFLDQIDDVDTGLIVWPGGALAESRTDRYGFEYEGLYNPETGKPSIADMMQIAIDKGAAFSVVLPTARYVGREDELREDVRGFMQDLLGGKYGELPEKMILEIGNEYYGAFSEPSEQGAAADYAAIADIMITEIANALADPAVNTSNSDLEIAVQSGRTLEDDAAIRDGLSEYAIANADMIVQHRFPATIEQVDDRLGTVEQIIDSWEQEAAGLNSEAPELFLSEWNVAHLTRQMVLEDFLQEPSSVEAGLTAADVDLDGRTTTEFEQYWQDAISRNAYGAEQPGLLLETFARYTELGMKAGGVYGIDVMHPGRMSWLGNDGEDHRFVGGEMLKMLYESVDNTYLVDAGSADGADDTITPYVFENDDKLVVFIAAGGNATGTYTLDIQGLGDMYGSVWAERLGAELQPDWMSDYGIVDNPEVDETPEAMTYATPVREAVDVQVNTLDDTLQLTVSAPYEVIRLAFAKTEAGAEEIASWSPIPETPLVERALDDPLETGDPAEDDGGLDSGALDIGGMVLLALLFLM